ncbi:MAG: hypothetical protein IJP02_02585 [Oscillospiraceae bacterium]|nr:hypothetical protein [Oscillospiraceae bacterium]
MEQFITTLAIILVGALIAACVTAKFKQKDCYINLEPMQRFDALCKLAPCPLQEAADGKDAEELFFCSSASALALTSRRLLLWVRDGKGYQLISLPINRIQAHLLSGDFSVPQNWPEIPDFILDHTGPKPLAPLYITTQPGVSDFPSQIVAIAQEDYPDFGFWYEYADSLN